MERLRQTLGPWTRPDLRIWPAYYDSSTQMLCLMVSPPASTPPNTDASWHYYPAEIEYTRRFLTVSTRYDYFQDSRPPIDAAPITVLFETTTLLRCSLSPGPHEPVPDTVRPPICATFADYVTTLPQWERDLLAKAMEDPFPDTPLNQLLQQRNVNILVASDGGHKTDYGSFGWVIGTKDEVIWDCQGTARGYPMQSYRAKGCGHMPLLLFLTHYIHYYDIQPIVTTPGY
jgi:hypothetical protein